MGLNEVFCEYLDSPIILYLDEIHIYRIRLQEYLEHVIITLDMLRKNRLYAKILTLIFEAWEVIYHRFLFPNVDVIIHHHKTHIIKETNTLQ